MARIINFFDPTLRMQQQRAQAEWNMTLRRLQQLRDFGLGDLPTYRFEEGPEFKESREAYRELAGLEFPESDIGGVGDLTAAEQAALIEQNEAIARQLGQSEEELRSTVGRLGGGGSEFQDIATQLQTGATSARVQALRGALQAGQQRVETRREQAIRGRETGGAGLGSLAQLREQGQQFGFGTRQTAAQQRIAALQNLVGNITPDLRAPTSSASYGPTFGGGFTKFGTGFSPLTTATELRNQYQPPILRGLYRSGGSAIRRF